MDSSETSDGQARPETQLMSQTATRLNESTDVSVRPMIDYDLPTVLAFRRTIVFRPNGSNFRTVEKLQHECEKASEYRRTYWWIIILIREYRVLLKIESRKELDRHR
jgi:hypothetical protein